MSNSFEKRQEIPPSFLELFDKFTLKNKYKRSLKNNQSKKDLNIKMKKSPLCEGFDRR